MTTRRILFGALAGFVLAVAGLAGALCRPAVQTWIVRRVLDSQNSVRASVGEVSAELRHVLLTGLTVELSSGTLTVPRVDAQLDVLRALTQKKVFIRSLVAKGWTFDLSRAKPAAAAMAREDPGFSFLASARAEPIPPEAARAFSGIFEGLRLPFDFSADHVDLEGDVLLPPANGGPSVRAHVRIIGGGIAAGSDAVLPIEVSFEFGGLNSPVSVLRAKGSLAAGMDTPRSFTRLAASLNVFAKGPGIPNGVELQAELSASKVEDTESYIAGLSRGGVRIATVRTEFLGRSGRIDGTWNLDLQDTDLVPFALGRALPSFSAQGSGVFEANASFLDLHAQGKLEGSVDRLGVIAPQLREVGHVTVGAQFDVGLKGDSLRVDTLRISVAGIHPVATIRALQAFEFNGKTGELRVADPAAEIVGMDLEGLPLAWCQGFTRDLRFVGSDARGQWAVRAGNGGLAVSSKAPLLISGLQIIRHERAFAEPVDVSASVAADYTPLGWQVQLSPLIVQSRGALVGTVQARIGRLAGSEPMKLTGNWNADPNALAGLLGSGAPARFSGGDLKGDFRASYGAKSQIEGSAEMEEVSLAGAPDFGQLAFSLQLRAELQPQGRIEFDVPVRFERNGRTSACDLSGWAKEGLATSVALKLTSSGINLDDTGKFAALVPSAGDAPPGAQAQAPADAPWSGLSGRIDLELKNLAYADSASIDVLSGALLIDQDSISLEEIRGSLAGGGRLKLDGKILHDADATSPISATADVTVDDYDPASYFKAHAPSDPAPVEGKFSLAGHLAGRASSLSGLPDVLGGALTFTSKAGIFRALSPKISDKLELANKASAVASFLGSFANAVQDRMGIATAAAQVQSMIQLTQALSLIPYDQLSGRIERDQNLDTALKDFELISPELRLSGAGTVKDEPHIPFVDQPLDLELKLRARGKTGELMKKLGVLGTVPDDLGYLECTLPGNLRGTPARPEAKELEDALLKRLIEKNSGSLLDRLIGK